MNRCILVARCPDGLGIVKAISKFFLDLECNLTEVAQFVDDKKLFTRWEACAERDSPALPDLAAIKSKFSPLAADYGMEWDIFDADVKPRILIAVSRLGHCLNDLLFRMNEVGFPARVVGVVSNHDVFREKVEWHGLPFHHLPVTPETKPKQEKQILHLMQELDVDLLVLARYMQILSDDTCQQLSGKAINIHHSFLPSFKGAKPYHQAHKRGVKITGATAHYVTSNLDEGPIIEQDIQRVEHQYSAGQLTQLGKHVETAVLAKAVYWHCMRRVLADGNRTIIFK